MLQPVQAPAIGVRVAGSDRPCSLYVYSDGSWGGASDLPADAPVRPLLAAAARNLHEAMAAWEQRMADGLLPTLGTATQPADSSAQFERDRALRFLAREMRETIRVDSMVAEIAARPNGSDRESLSVRIWVAREVDAAPTGKRREFDLYSMRLEWAHGSGGWALGRISGFAATYWPPEVDSRVPTPFPARPPLWAQATNEERERLGAKIAGRWRDITWIEDGTMLPPYPVVRDAEPPTPFGVPVPAKTVQPAYPEFAREAQIVGMVVLHVLVGTEGGVEDVKLVRGVTGLNDAAMDAVRQWIFEPAKDEAGNPVPAWYEAKFDFHF
jgi:protein TonB